MPKKLSSHISDHKPEGQVEHGVGIKSSQAYEQCFYACNAMIVFKNTTTQPLKLNPTVALKLALNRPRLC